MNSTTLLKVGELARRTGLTVRTLHHFDQIGLLTPAIRTEAGHRLYNEANVERLQQITTLRALGLGLDAIRRCLSNPEVTVRRLVQIQLKRLVDQSEQLRLLTARLGQLDQRLDGVEPVSVDELLDLIREITMFEKYYTPEQLEQLKTRAEEVGETRIKEVEAEWPLLMERVQSAMDRGVPASDPEAKVLARQWMSLVQEFTGGDPGISASLKNLWQSESQVHGIETNSMRPMMDYVNQSLQDDGN